MNATCTAPKTGKHTSPKREAECPACGGGSRKATAGAVSAAPKSAPAKSSIITDESEFFEALYDSFKNRSKDLGVSTDGDVQVHKWEAEIPNGLGTITVERRLHADYDPTAENYGLIRDSRYTLSASDGTTLTYGTDDMDPEYLDFSTESPKAAAEAAQKGAKRDREDEELWADWDWIVEGHLGDWLTENYK